MDYFGNKDINLNTTIYSKIGSFRCTTWKILILDTITITTKNKSQKVKT